MVRRLTSFILAALIAIPLAPLQAAAGPNPEKEARLAEKVKAGIAKLGVGQESRVKLKLKNKTKLVGYVSGVEDEHFSLTDPDSGHATTIAYADVAQVQGNNLSTRTKIIITAAVVAGVIITLYLVRGAFCDGR